MTKFSPHFGRPIKGKISLLLPHLTLLTALIAKIRPEQSWRELYEASLLELDRSKLPERVRAAREAIHRRLSLFRVCVWQAIRGEGVVGPHSAPSSGYRHFVGLRRRAVVACLQKI